MQTTDLSKIDLFSLAKAARLIQNGEIIGIQPTQFTVLVQTLSTTFLLKRYLG
jgi:hypothetical protein